MGTNATIEMIFYLHVCSEIVFSQYRDAKYSVNYILPFGLQKKIVPQNIRRDLYEAHRRMEDAESTLQAAADGLKKCCKNVLHEDAIRYRARSMTEAHYHSLKQPFVGIVGQEHSAMLHWLNLSVNSANPSQGGACKIDGTYKCPFFSLYGPKL